MKRRDAIKTMGALAGTAATARLLAACGDSGPGTIDTFVFMMMENRSYDHWLGSRSLLEGLPGDGLTAAMSNPDLDGNPIAIYPAGTDELLDQCVPDPPHSWDASRTQFDGGTNDGFIRAYQQRHGTGYTQAMEYMVREQVPVTYAIADAYTSCDRWFSSVLGPTLPNRMFWHAATSNGAKANDEVVGGAFEGVKSVHHRMNEAGIDWAYYYNDVPVLGVVKDLDYEGRLRRFLYDFIDDAAAGKLPTVCHIDPGFGTNDDHPPHHPLLGQQLISAVYTALANSPQWERCMLVITYDEHGGFYDHVPPPTTVDDRASEGFDQLGFRVPAVVAGPYVKQGYVSSVQYDHTSAIKHIQNQLGFERLTMRSDAANDLADCIDLERLEAGDPAPPVEMPAVEIDEANLPDECRSGADLKPVSPGFHDVIDWAEAEKARLGKWYRPHERRDYVYGIGEYLDHYNRGRIRRRR